MNHIHVTLCTLFDYFGVLNVRNTVIKEIKNFDFFYPSNFLELVQYIIFPNSFVCGIKDENKLVAFSSVTVTHGVYEIEDTAVLPNYRGVGMQKEMWNYIITYIPEDSLLICTIHPLNKHSLSNALSLGFKIVKRENMYNSERYVLEYRKPSK